MEKVEKNISFTELCQTLRRAESTVKKYLHDYHACLGTNTEMLQHGVTPLVATQLSVIRDLKHARVPHEDIIKVLTSLGDNDLWAGVQNMGPTMREKRKELAKKAGTAVTTTIGVVGFLLALKSQFDSKKHDKETKHIRELLEDHIVNYNKESRRLFETLEEWREEFDTPTSLLTPLRHRPATLSVEDVRRMLKQRGFFHDYWNRNGKGLKHSYKRIARGGEVLVYDFTTNLIWQQGGSQDWIEKWEKAKKHVQNLNWNHYAGYNDWRLPTLEEAMSLMEPKKHGDLYIDPIFDSLQSWIWTCDKVAREPRAWVVLFYLGGCFNPTAYGDYCVRAVRSRPSSVE